MNAAWIAKHFPQYAQLVQETLASQRGDGAITACGVKLKNKGRCNVQGSVDDKIFNIAFKDMEVELPILSVRKMVRHGNDVQFKDKGGTITDRSTGRVIRFFEHEGVYFLKFKVSGPNSDTSQLDFHRLGVP